MVVGYFVFNVCCGVQVSVVSYVGCVGFDTFTFAVFCFVVMMSVILLVWDCLLFWCVLGDLFMLLVYGCLLFGLSLLFVLMCLIAMVSCGDSVWLVGLVLSVVVTLLIAIGLELVFYLIVL